MTCPNGHLVEPGIRYCTTCGAAVGQADAVDAAPAGPAPNFATPLVDEVPTSSEPVPALPTNREVSPSSAVDRSGSQNHASMDATPPTGVPVTLGTTGARSIPVDDVTSRFSAISDETSTEVSGDPAEADGGGGASSDAPHSKRKWVIATVAAVLVVAGAMAAVLGHANNHHNKTTAADTLPTASQATKPATGGYACPEDATGNEGQYSYLLQKPTASIDTLDSELTNLEGSEDKSVQTEAHSLAHELSALKPTPTSALSALGELHFKDVPVATQLTSLNKNVSSDCNGRPLFAQTAVSGVDQLTPYRKTGGVELGTNVYGTCTNYSVLSWDSPFNLVIKCENAVDLLNLATGTLSAVATAPSTAHVAAVGTQVAWATVIVHTSTGLTARTWTEILRLHTVGSGTAHTVTLAAGQTGTLPGNTVTVVTTGVPNRVLTTFTQDALVVRGATGKVLAKVTGSATTSCSTKQGPTWWTISACGHLYDLYHLNTILTSWTDWYTDGGCGLHALVVEEDTRFTSVYKALEISDGASGPTVLPFSANFLSSTTKVIGMTAAGALAQYGTGKIAMLNASGGVVWQLPHTVVQGAKIVLGWVVVTNTSNKQVIVNPATGKQATVTATLVSMITAPGTSVKEASIPSSNDFIYTLNGLMYHKTLSSVCAG